jgi:hypothetical protein
MNNLMVITFNEQGQLNLCDHGQPTESDVAPNLYIVWDDDKIPPTKLTWNIGRGKGQSPSQWTGTPNPAATVNLSAFDGPSLITYSNRTDSCVIEFENNSISHPLK